MVTDADLEPMLRAVPGYASGWLEERQSGSAAGPDPNPGLDFWFFDGLAHHLATRAAAGDFTEFVPMFAALDRLYWDWDAADACDVGTVLTTGVLETLIYSLRREGVDLGLIARQVTGDTARAGWEAAYAYTVTGPGKYWEIDFTPQHVEGWVAGPARVDQWLATNGMHLPAGHPIAQ